MKTFKQYLNEQNGNPNKVHLTKYAPHPGYGFKGGTVLGSSAGGDEEELEEGNPLARVTHHAKEGRHFVGLTSYRTGKSSKENKSSFKELKQKIRKQGYGFREAEGHWEGGKERSLVVHAKAPGAEAGRDLVRDMIGHGRHYGQDSIYHHNGEAGHLIGTNESGYPGNKKVVRVGKLRYNKPEAEFQTELRPSKKKAPARFTSGD